MDYLFDNEFTDKNNSAYIPDSNGVQVSVGDVFDAYYTDQIVLKAGNIEIPLHCKPIGDDADSFSVRKKLLAAIKSIDVDKDARTKTVTVSITGFVNTHLHSYYSLLDGASRPEDIAERAEHFCALTDHGNMIGTLEFYKAMKKLKKKAIIGIEGYTETIDGEKKCCHMILLAKNETGFQNLVKITSAAYRNFYKKPNISYQMLEQYHEGIVATSACLGGEIPRWLQNGKYEKAKTVAQKMISIFGAEDFYIEIQRHGISEENSVNPQLVRLAKEVGVKMVCAADSHYLNKDDERVHDILLCIGTKRLISEPNRFRMQGNGYHVPTRKEMEKLFADFPETLDSTLEIAKKCNVTMDFDKIYMPEFKVPVPFKNEVEFFEYQCHEGFKKRFEKTPNLNSKEYIDRLEYEIDVIKKMKFCGYFDIVADFVNYAKSKGIFVGPGRGSACGSLVAYCMYITEVDPIPYGLLFERFLNPDRASMPDIDLDFEDARRDEVIDYVKRKYGESAISRILAVGRIMARKAVRDVARVLEKPYALGDKIAKEIPKTVGMTLSKALKANPSLKQMYDGDMEIKEIIDIALKIEGNPRNISQHACGLLITPSAVDNYIPQLMAENRLTHEFEPTTQFQKDECEEMGLLKMDFLGLRTMGVCANALKDINQRRKSEGKNELTFADIPITDVETYRYISEGNTLGVFQLESPGMTGFMRQLFQDASKYVRLKDKTKREAIGGEFFERLVAGISLYRPGPIDEIPNYINNMLAPNKVEYETPQLQDILNTTYGIIVYQEQCMFIVRVLAGFNMKQADYIRKAMAKKKKWILDEYKDYFVDGSKEADAELAKNGKHTYNILGCVANGIDRNIAKDIWGKMESFAEYAFNKSHAVGYAIISAKTAWLAKYYPTEYTTAILNSFIEDPQKLKIYVSKLKKLGIQLLSPDVNFSGVKFSAAGKNIRFGLMGVNGIGKISASLVDERRNGRFTTFEELVTRLTANDAGKKSFIEALIYSGACDEFGYTRRSLLDVLDKVIEKAKNKKNALIAGQISLFDSNEFKEYDILHIPAEDEFEKDEKLKLEHKYTGLYISEHPLDQYEKQLKNNQVSDISNFIGGDELDEQSEEIESEQTNRNGQYVKLAGMVSDMKVIYTKKQKPEQIYVFTIEDRSGSIKAVMFANTIRKANILPEDGKLMMVTGKIQVDDFGTQIIVDNTYKIDENVCEPVAVVVYLPNKIEVNSACGEVFGMRGSLPIYFYKNGKHYKSRGCVQNCISDFEKLKSKYGKVEIKYPK